MSLHPLRLLALTLGLALPMQVVAQSGARHEGTRLSTIIIYSPQLKALARFYEQALELPAPTVVQDQHIGYWLGANYVGFEPADDKVRRPGGVSAWFQVVDIKATYERLLKLGAVAHEPPAVQPWGDLHAVVVDPDGNRLGLIQSAGKSR